MAIPNPISTGEQSVTATGAITGVLDTSTLSGDFTVYARVRGLTGSQSIRIDMEDTANSSAFSDATQVYTFEFVGAPTPDGETKSVRAYHLKSARVGGTNNKLRGNVQEITNGATALVTLWVDE
jgi:hypothetical protein